MKDIKVLDCTLRDGGCVNNFDFGSYYMNLILCGLEKANVDIIELGYIDEKDGSDEGRTKFSNDRAIVENFLKQKKDGCKYVAMIDYGKFNPDNLCERTENSIDGIRLAFHKKDRYKMIEWGKTILNKGYELYMQPMLCMRYTDEELIEYVKLVNKELPRISAFYIVDSFGEMRLNDVNRVAMLIDHNLNKEITMGFHSHNNLELSYSNAVALLNFSMERNLIFDASVMGMGKGAGNMKTEIFAEHLNLLNHKHYNVKALMETVDRALNQLKQNYTWGYSVEYFLSAINQCSPSYANHFYNKHMLSIEKVSELLSMIAEDKKISFDKAYADKLYYKYNSRKYNDHNSVAYLLTQLKGKRVLLLAPGKSIEKNVEVVSNYMKEPDVVSISLNSIPLLTCDYIFITKEIIMEYLTPSESKLLVTSNVTNPKEDSIIFDYATLAVGEPEVRDIALNLIINILEKCNVKDIMFAGFDGFSGDADQNYFDERLKRPISKSRAVITNKRMVQIIQRAKSFATIHFLTESCYEKQLV